MKSLVGGSSKCYHCVMVDSRFITAFLCCVALLITACGSEKSHEPPVNTPPRITSVSEVVADVEIPFCYRVAFVDPDGPMAAMRYESLPSWLIASADSLCGTPPVGATDTSFRVIVSDSRLIDTQQVTIRIARAILVYGDTRTNHDIHRQVVAQMMLQRPVVVFHVGDLVENGFSASQWDTFNIITAGLRSVAEFFPALGNHESQSPLFFSNFNLPNNEQWYSVERDSIHFIVLNSCVSIQPGSEQLSWLDSDLAQVADSIKFIVVVLHHPPYSTGPHTEDEVGLRETVVPLFERYGVAVVFAGHDHAYERSFCGGRYYIVTGGGGAPLHDQARQYPCSQLYLKTHEFCRLTRVGDELRVRVYDSDLNLIDQIEINRSRQ
jgi:acid phosphatase type 7